ncbi:MAG: HGGxSTG domain-containing protein [Pseudomonadota bacterium]|nr:HGGxSTG domain-containing protein [Pseudomonadota bacterium]
MCGTCMCMMVGRQWSAKLLRVTPDRVNEFARPLFNPSLQCFIWACFMNDPDLMQIPKQRCGAKTRSGKPCQSRPMPNGRCRMHGGKSPGAPVGNQNAFKHGKYSSWATAMKILFSTSAE